MRQRDREFFAFLVRAFHLIVNDSLQETWALVGVQDQVWGFELFWVNFFLDGSAKKASGAWKAMLKWSSRRFVDWTGFPFASAKISLSDSNQDPVSDVL